MPSRDLQDTVPHQRRFAFVHSEASPLRTLAQAHWPSVRLVLYSGCESKEKARATFSVTLRVANCELLVAKHISGRNPHVVVVGDSIGVQREPVKLGRTQRDMLRRPDVQSAAEHHGKSVGRAR